MRSVKRMSHVPKDLSRRCETALEEVTLLTLVTNDHGLEGKSRNSTLLTNGTIPRLEYGPWVVFV